MVISPFTPLCFDPYVSDGLPCRHTQVWAPLDTILIQVICDAEESEPFASVANETTHRSTPITWQTWQMNTDRVLYFATLSGLSAGYYRVYINEMQSEVFRITSDQTVLEKTTVIRYRFKDNRERDDVVSLINNVPYFFYWRVPGGFKDSGWSFGVTNEQFSTQHADLVELYARDYINKTFSLGGPEGVPVWYGALLNRLLTCTYVYIGDDRYVRNESEVPTMNVLVDGMDAFVFTQTVRQYKSAVVDEETGLVMLRNVDDTINRNTDNENVMIL